MPDLFADDLFEIHGTHISISSIEEFRLREVEYIMRPVYYERSQVKWGGLFKGSPKRIIEFDKMEYYAAVIGEERYKNAIEEARTNNIFEAVVKTAADGIADAVANLAKKPAVQRIRYRIMNASGRVSERTLAEIPAVLMREDGKRSEVFANDELFSLLGEPIAPTIVMVPALFIKSKDGKYIFFGNGIQVQDIEQEYERLKMAVRYVKEMRKQKGVEKKGNAGLLEGVIKQIPAIPQVQVPFLKSGKKKKTEEVEPLDFVISEKDELK